MEFTFRKIRDYAENRTSTFHLILASISFVLYVCIIIFGFAPTSQEISQSGFITSDLQSAHTRLEVDTILSAWAQFMPAVIRLSILDYIFIVAGFVLFFSLNSLLIRSFASKEKFQFIPIIGICLTILSRSLDALEDLWAILIYSNPENYPNFLIPLLNYTETLKWIVVGFEYSALVIGIILLIVYKISLKKKNHQEIE